MSCGHQVSVLGTGLWRALHRWQTACTRKGSACYRDNALRIQSWVNQVIGEGVVIVMLVINEFLQCAGH